MPPQLRVARPSKDLEAATAFYTRGLGLEVLATFEDHAGFDGVILGHPGWPYHFEFTMRQDDPVLAVHSDEDLLVLHLAEAAIWAATVERLRAFGAPEVVNSNPYWNERGLTFKDPDGNLIVLQNADWP